MKAIESNYAENGEVKSIDFSLYTDEDVKVFAKDLKEYNGTTLQYIGIMPINQDLDQYVKSVDSTKLNDIISNLKELKRENFKDGVITRIKGFIQKFNFACWRQWMCIIFISARIIFIINMKIGFNFSIFFGICFYTEPILTLTQRTILSKCV